MFHLQFLLCTALLVFTWLLPSQVSADLIAITNNQELISVDAMTGQGTLIANIGPIGSISAPDFGGLAFDPGRGKIFAVDISSVDPATNSRRLVSIDPASGAATIVGPLGLNISASQFANIQGLAFDSSTGTLFGSTFGGDSQLLSIDTANGEATPIGSLGLPGAGIFGMTVDTSSSTLNGVLVDSGFQLGTVDPLTGVTSAIGPVGSVTGLAYDRSTDTLYGVDANTLVRINRTTGASVPIGSGIGFVGILGLTSTAVPEPTSSLILALTAFAGVAFRRVR